MTFGSSVPQRRFFFAVIVLSFGQWLFPGGSSDSAAGSPLANALWVVAYLVALVGVAVERDVALKLMRASLPLVAILLLACMSTLWSDQPMLTARRSLELVGTVALTLHLISRLKLVGFIETLADAISVAAAISLVLVVLFPSFAISQVEETKGNWQGVFNHKNTLGMTMVLGMATISCLLDRSRGVGRNLRIASLAMCVVLLIGSKNAGSYGTAVMLALILPLLLWCRAKQRAVLAFWTVVVSATVILFTTLTGFGVNGALDAVGKDSTLTGRSDLWQLVMDAIAARPAGYGYGVFWGGDGPAGRLVYPYIYWEPGSAHNGFLEVPLDLGVLGEVALVLLLALALWRAWFLFWRGHDWSSAWPLLVILCVVSENLSEATFAMYNLVDWIVFVAAFFFASEVVCARSSLRTSGGIRTVPASR